MRIVVIRHFHPGPRFARTETRRCCLPEAYAVALQYCIKEFREQVSSIMNSAESGIVAIDEDGIIIMANRLAEDLLGIRSIESIGRHILDVIPNTRLMEIMESGKPLTGQTFHGRSAPPGQLRACHPRRQGRGSRERFPGLLPRQEILPRTEVVKGLNRELESIIHSSYDGIWITDAEGRVLDINEAYERITGIRAKEVLGLTMQELVDRGYFDQSVTILVMKELRSITINQTVKGKKQILVTGNRSRRKRQALPRRHQCPRRHGAGQPSRTTHAGKGAEPQVRGRTHAPAIPSGAGLMPRVPQQADGADRRACGKNGRGGLHAAHHGRVRYGQGAGRQARPPAGPGRREPLHQHQLRRHPGAAPRERALRLREERFTGAKKRASPASSSSRTTGRSFSTRWRSCP